MSERERLWIEDGSRFGIFPNESERYSPLYINHDFGVDSWSVDFQMTPSPAVIVSGRKPTRDEFFASLRTFPISICSAEALWVATVSAWDKQGLDNG